MVAGEAKPKEASREEFLVPRSDGLAGVGRRTVVAIGDVHFPFASRLTLSRVYEIVMEAQPDAVVQLGDLTDSYSASKYPRSHNIMTPREERAKAREMAVAFWDSVHRAAPSAACYQLLGNHCLRRFKRTLESLPEMEDEVWSALVEDHTFPGVTLCDDPRQPLIIDDVAYEHGALKAGEHCSENGMHTVCAHSHVGGVVHRGRLWELNAGFCADVDAPVFDYVRTRLVAKRTTQGVGLVDGWGGRFIPL